VPPSLAALGRGLLELAFPARCPACGRPAHGGRLCDACLAQIEPTVEPSLETIDSLSFAVAKHAGPAAQCVRAFKYRRDWAAGRALALLLRERTPAEMLGWAEIICPVPLHRLRLLGRGFNQAAWLARRLDQGQDRLRARLLLRLRHTRPQARLNGQDRLANVSGAFAVNPRLAAQVDGRRVLLVDDVQTTGATLHECTMALLAAGAVQVRALTVSRAMGEIHDKP